MRDHRAARRKQRRIGGHAVSSREAIVKLRYLAGRAHELGPVGAEFARAFDVYEAEAHRGLTLDEALGLAVGVGGEPWWAAERRGRRDEAIRRLAVLLAAPGTCMRERARIVKNSILRYGAGRWRFDRNLTLDEIPNAYLGKPDSWLFTIFRESEGRPPTGGTRLAEILAAQPSKKNAK